MLELQGEIHETTITVGDFNITLSKMDRSTRKTHNKDILEVNIFINTLDLTFIQYFIHQWQISGIPWRYHGFRIKPPK